MARYFGTNIISGDINGLTNAQYNAINSGITAAKVDDIVYKSTAQTITGEKTFAGGQTTKFKDNSNTIGTFSADTWSTSNLYFSDSAGSRIARIQPAYVTGTNILKMGMYASNGTTTEQGITVRSDGITYAPTPANSSSTSETKIATTGWVNNSTASTNVVHRDSAETISGNKTFSGTNTFSGTVSLGSSATATTPTSTDNSTAVATTAFVRTRESGVVHLTGTETISGNKTLSGTNSFSGTNTFSGTTNIYVPLLTKQNNDKEGGQIAFQRADNDTYGNFNPYIDLYDGKIRFVGGTVGSEKIPCQIDFANNQIIGTATRAEYADLAENYESDSQYPIGTLIKFGGEKDITIANINCNGVISEKPGYLLDSKLENSQPVALVGKTPIRILGKIKKFDRIVLDTEHPGLGKVQVTSDEKIIAIALEDSNLEEEKLVKCVTKFNLD